MTKKVIKKTKSLKQAFAQEAKTYPIRPVPQSNVLILPHGYKEFQDMAFRTDENRTEFKMKNRKEMGHPTTEAPKREEIPPFKGWLLPANFCIDCGKTDISGELTELVPGIIQLEHPMPEIDLTKSDVIWTWICGKCFQHELWGSDKQLYLPKGVHHEALHVRRKRAAVDWVKAAKLRGEHPIECRERR